MKTRRAPVRPPPPRAASTRVQMSLTEISSRKEICSRLSQNTCSSRTLVRRPAIMTLRHADHSSGERFGRCNRAAISISHVIQDASILLCYGKIYSLLLIGEIQPIAHLDSRDCPFLMGRLREDYGERLVLTGLWSGQDATFRAC